MTEIFGTLGPACAQQRVLEEMFDAGLTGMRLNLSHCDLTDSADQITAFQAAAAAKAPDSHNLCILLPPRCEAVSDISDSGYHSVSVG